MKNLKSLFNHVVPTVLTTVCLATFLVLVSYFSIKSSPTELVTRVRTLSPTHHTSSHSTASSSPSASISKPDHPIQASVSEAYSKMPLYFIENRGQVDSRVAYYVQGSDKILYFTSEGITFVLNGQIDLDDSAEVPPHTPSLHPVAFRAEGDDAAQQWALKLDFVGSKSGVKPIAQDRTSAIVSYFKGRQDQWQTGLKTYATIVYSDLWPGIDLIYTGTANRLKYTFMVKPGADPNQIRLAYRGASDVRLNDEGKLEVNTPVGGFLDDKPYSYQEADKGRVDVVSSYILHPEASNESLVYGFRLGEYDVTKKLVIDPAAIIYSGFIGGASNDEGNGIAVDLFGSDENVFVAGTTMSTGGGPGGFPEGDGFGSIPGFRKSLDLAKMKDAFIARINQDGHLVYASYIGGNGADEGKAVAVDHVSGEAYLVGTVGNDDASNISFPAYMGTPDGTYNGGETDAFVVKMSQDGTSFVFASFLGGSGNDEGLGAATDSDGNVYITGTTSSKESSFPTGDGFKDSLGAIPGFDHTFRGGSFFGDAFAVEIFFDGSAFGYATYIGGEFDDHGRGIAVDPAGNTYITGDTESPGFPPVYPTPAAGLEPHNQVIGSPSVGDAFVVKLNAGDLSKDPGTEVLYLAFIGGDEIDVGNAIAVDHSGNAYVTGLTGSPPRSPGPIPKPNFPVKKGPILDYRGGFDAFVARILADGVTLDYAGYIGGADEDIGKGIAVDDFGSAYVVGRTRSTQANGFPAMNGLKQDNAGGSDAFVAKVKADGAGLDYAAFVGGSDEDFANAVTVTVSGKAFLTGTTSSGARARTPFPFKAQDVPRPGPDLSHNGGSDAFVANINDVPGRTLTGVDLGIFPPTSPTLVPIGTTISLPITVSNIGTEVATDVRVASFLPGSLVFISCSSSNGECQGGADNSFIATIPSLPPGVSEKISVEALVPCSVPAGTVIRDALTVRSSLLDDSLGDNSATLILTTFNPPFDIECPGDVVRSLSAGQTSAAVSYTEPRIIGSCLGATISCSPPSGSIFPIGATSVTCLASNSTGETSTCTFTVGVSSPILLTCPSGISIAIPSGQGSIVVNYPPPTVTPSQATTVICAPPTGSSFPIGTTQVVCVATSGSNSSANCFFNVAVQTEAGFNVCLQDDSTGDTMLINSSTGNYQFNRCADGLTVTGRGLISKHGNILAMEDNEPDRRVRAQLDGEQSKGLASMQILTLGRMFTIIDRNTANNTCICP